MCSNDITLIDTRTEPPVANRVLLNWPFLGYSSDQDVSSDDVHGFVQTRADFESAVVTLKTIETGCGGADCQLDTKIDAAAQRPDLNINTPYADALSSAHFGPVDYVDMKVLWFYTSATCKSLSGDGDDQRPLQETLQNAVVQSAFESPFLMSTLLALTSLHMKSLGQDLGAKKALYYCGTAFEGHRKAIAVANPKSYGALLTNALLLSLLSSPALRRTGEPRLLLVDWLLMWRGLSSVFTITGSECIESSGLGALFSRPDVQPHATSAAVPKELLMMLSRVTADDEEFSDVRTYYETLRCLGSLYHHLFEYGIDNMMVMRIATWFTLVPASFTVLAPFCKAQPLGCEPESIALRTPDREASHEAIKSTLMVEHPTIQRSSWSLEEMDHMQAKSGLRSHTTKNSDNAK
ncbi:hypothetical protein MBLNU13_g06906t1 [Cladosporium sp. NU13]